MPGLNEAMILVSQALENEAVLTKFRNVYEKMHGALDGMPYDELAISDEVKEQVRCDR